MSVSPAVHDILEATATRLETTGWGEGGSTSFRLTDYRFTPTTKLCLLDALGAQAWAYITEKEYLPLSDGICGLLTELREIVIPALYRTILAQPDLTDDARRNLTFPSPAPDIAESEDPFFGAVAWYNDFVCTNGQDASKIIRETAKEL